MTTTQSEQAERDYIAAGLTDMKREIDNILCDNSLQADRATRERLKRLQEHVKIIYRASVTLTTL